jgi:uncharacterized phage-associated protein
VEAWRYGPVIPSLYRRLKAHGSGPVTETISPIFGHRPEQLDPDDRALVDAVYAKYGHLSGPQLSHLTHRPGTPWAEAYEPDSYGVELDDGAIRVHYATLLNDRRVQPAG